MKDLNTLNHYFVKYKYHLILGTLFTIISNFFSIIPAQLVRHSFDLIADTIRLSRLTEESALSNAVDGHFTRTILVYGVLILGMALLRGVFLFFMRQTIIVMSRLIEYDQKNEIYAHYQSLSVSFYRRNNTGDLMARISEDVSRVRMYIGPAIMYGLNMVTLFIMLIWYMFSINATLTFWVLLPLPFLSLSIYYVNNIINARSEEIQSSLSRLSTFVQEAFSGIRVAKAFVKEEESALKFTDESNDYRRKSLRLNTVEALFFPLIMMLIGLSTILAVYIGGLEVAKGNITTGVIAEFIIYVNLLTWPVTSLGWIISIIQRAEASQKRINEFLNIRSELTSTADLKTPIKGDLEFVNVSFVYPDSGIQALKNLSFKVPSGETLAIVGTTGSGKSTIANLLTRMYDPTSGTILVDGRDIKAYNLNHLRSHIGYVPQDVFLFSDSIKNNILFGAVNESEEAIIKAAKDADLYENIVRFPKGLETMLGERGITLSGGQKQRVSIARALVRNPEVLILDDCLSAVDTKTENEILRNLKSVTKDRTSVIISHRLSSVKLADHILVLDDGEMVEYGTHEELYSNDGVYRELYEKQLEVEAGEGTGSQD